MSVNLQLQAPFFIFWRMADTAFLRQQLSDVLHICLGQSSLTLLLLDENWPVNEQSFEVKGICKCIWHTNTTLPTLATYIEQLQPGEVWPTWQVGQLIVAEIQFFQSLEGNDSSWKGGQAASPKIQCNQARLECPASPWHIRESTIPQTEQLQGGQSPGCKQDLLPSLIEIKKDRGYCEAGKVSHVRPCKHISWQGAVCP